LLDTSALLGAAVFVAAFVAALCANPGAARAQLSDPEFRPTRGPQITDARRAGDADATAVELNPAQLGLLTAGSQELVASGGTQASAMASRNRRGAGLYWGATILGPNAIGAALTGVTDSGYGIGHTTLRLAYALRLGRGMAIGAAWAHIWGGPYAGADTFDIGLSIRAGRWAALGVTVEDGWQPNALPRLWNAELALRPMGTDRLEIGLGAGHANGDQWKLFVPRARVSVALVDGLRLYAEGERVPAGTAVAFEGGADP
jgi:hypothetical protein